MRDLETRIANSKQTSYAVKRKNLLPISHQKNHALEQKLQKALDDKGKIERESNDLQRTISELKDRLGDTTEHLKQANFCKLFFLSFYKDFEQAADSYSIEEVQRIQSSYKLNSINLEMDKAESLVTGNQCYIRNLHEVPHTPHT